MPLRTRKTWFDVVLDAPDARTLAHFYERLLGWSVFNESDGWVDLAPSEDAGYNFSFVTEKDYARPVWPTVDGEPQMSMHLDIEVTTWSKLWRTASRWARRWPSSNHRSQRA